MPSPAVSAANTPIRRMRYSGSRHTALSPPAFEQCPAFLVRADRPTSAADRSAHGFVESFLALIALHIASRPTQRRVAIMLSTLSRSVLLGTWAGALALIVAASIAM